jgi:hypothetical protein
MRDQHKKHRRFLTIEPPRKRPVRWWVIHDWADDVAVLKNVRTAAPPDARVVLVEWVIPETAEIDSGKWMDINMLVNAGGRERTASEFGILYEQRALNSSLLFLRLRRYASSLERCERRHDNAARAML